MSSRPRGYKCSTADRFSDMQQFRDFTLAVLKKENKKFIKSKNKMEIQIHNRQWLHCGHNGYELLTNRNRQSAVQQTSRCSLSGQTSDDAVRCTLDSSGDRQRLNLASPVSPFEILAPSWSCTGSVRCPCLMMPRKAMWQRLSEPELVISGARPGVHRTARMRVKFRTSSSSHPLCKCANSQIFCQRSKH